MTLQATLEPLLHSPHLPEIVESLQSRLAVEAAARRKFYEDMTDDQKVEFIDGEVVLHSPARWGHLQCRRRIEALLAAYVQLNALGEVSGERCLCVFRRNDYEPDVVYFGPHKASALSDDTMKHPVPDLAVEVLSDSTESRDRGVKFEDFAASGVVEYWIVDAEAKIVEQYFAKDRAYELSLKSGSGEIASQAIAGLRLPIAAFFDAAAHTSALRAIMAA